MPQIEHDPRHSPCSKPPDLGQTKTLTEALTELWRADWTGPVTFHFHHGIPRVVEWEGKRKRRLVLRA